MHAMAGNLIAVGDDLHDMTTRALTLLVATVLLAACGGNAAPAVDLSARGEEGRAVMRSSGCAACHGSHGDGGVGPSFLGLFGSTVQLDDGSSVTADRDYLRESITDPRAKIVEGYDVPMPDNDLSDAEIEAIIDYIAELADVEAER
jgi:cytochrome c oxidase subunit II